MSQSFEDLGCRLFVVANYIGCDVASVAVPHHFEANPDSILTIYFDVDPDPTFTLMRIRIQTRIRILPFTLMWILILILPQIGTLICSKMIQHNPLTIPPFLFNADFFNDPKKQE